MSKFVKPISGDALRQLPPVVKIIDPPGMMLRRTKKVECVAPSKCPICGYFAEQMAEAILRPKTFGETLELVRRFASYSHEAQMDILQRVGKRLG